MVQETATPEDKSVPSPHKFTLTRSYVGHWIVNLVIPKKEGA